MQHSEIMTSHVVTAGIDENVQIVQDLFQCSRFHHLRFLDEDDILVGVVSDRNLLKVFGPSISTLVVRPQDLRTLTRRVQRITSRRPISPSKNHTVRDAAIPMSSSLGPQSFTTVPAKKSHPIRWSVLQSIIVCDHWDRGLHDPSANLSHRPSNSLRSG